MGYVVAFVFGCLFVILLASKDDIMRRWEKRRINRRYERLLNGTPKQTVFLTSFEQMRKYRDYPFYIDGNVYGVRPSCFWRWDCSRHVILEDNAGKILGYVNEIVLSRHVDSNGKVNYKRGISVSENPTQLGKLIYPSAVIEVY